MMMIHLAYTYVNTNVGAIQQPNLYALCTMHYIAEHGNDPPVVTFPYPGMDSLMANKAWMMKAGSEHRNSY